MTDVQQTPTTDEQAAERAAREDWERRIYRRLTDTQGADPRLALPAVTGVTATPAAGHVLLAWDAVPDAVGYLIECTGPDGDAALLQHGGSDVPAVVGPRFAVTGLPDGVDHSFRVAAIAGNEYPAWAWSEPVTGQTSGAAGGTVQIQVDAASATGTLDRVWYMTGSERLTQLRFGDDGHGNRIGTEFAEALRIAHEDLGVTYVRAHAILHDDNAVVTRADDGTLAYDFSNVDSLYDQILDLGIRPIVELSFMPAALAADPDQTVFAYRGIISPPRDWSEWHAVVRELAAHLVERYGIDEVATWGFEVWNEPNLEVFWTGTQEEYLRLYDESVRAVKSVHERLPVGGPSTAASEWIEALAAHAAEQDEALDFVTTHTYGNLPLDFRPTLRRNGYPDAKIWWTEWGVGSTHYGPVHDGVSGAPFALSGFRSVQGRVDALSYWVISDHFEELGRGPTLFHNGFGLLTVGNLRKPRYWAVHLAAHQGDTVLATALDGDGAEVLVEAWATRHEDGTVDVLAWNGTINSAVMDGDDRLARSVAVRVDALPAGRYRAEVARVDAEHSNITTALPAGTDWPDTAQWADLHARDRLHVETLGDITPDGSGSTVLELDLPQPGIARVRLSPADTDSSSSTSTDEGTR